MIAPPARIILATRAPAAPGTATPDPTDPDAADTPNVLDAGITAHVARASTPEDEALERQREAFDFVIRARAESERETNALRDLAMEQMKHDDEILKKWIAMI
jgi:hypothetical protein